jgi:RHS repeat-associated protein
MPTLVYNSRLARPYPIVPISFTPDNTGSPLVNVSQVRAVLRIGGNVVNTRSWLVTLPTVWPNDVPAPVYRFGIGYGSALTPLATGLYDYTLEVMATYTNGVEDTTNTSGQFVVVNRTASPFGAGWWVAGVESLYFPSDTTTRLWVGGDGSYRVYRKVATNTWVPDAWDRPDTLRYQPDSLQYVRTLPGRVEVRFDGLGHHVRTRNKAGHWTTFEWSGSQLTRIHLPRASAFNTGYSYLFEYNNTGGKLSRVVAPGSGREVTFAMDSGRITSISGPDTTSVGFTYSGTSALVSSRTDRRGIATTFTFNSGFRLTRVTNTMGTGGTGDDISVGFTPAETEPLFDAIPFDSLYTEIDGPRPDVDVVDKTRFYVNDAGVPRWIRNALGYKTFIFRNDPRWPGLVTQVWTPYGRTSFEGNRTTTAAYDARGNLVSSTDWSTQDSTGRPAVTMYSWDPVWDAVTEITAPEGEITRIAYDSATGNRLWEQPGPSATRRVTYSYNAANDALAPGLLQSVTTPAAGGNPAATQTLFYDARGNLRATRSPLGFYTLAYSDAIGRDTLSITPIDTISARDSTALRSAGARQRSVYDVWGRVTLAQSIGPAVDSIARAADTGSGFTLSLPAETVTVRNTYDRDLLASVERWSSPDRNGIGIVTTRWRYDAAGRKVAEIAPGSSPGAEMKDSTTYDAAGNVVATRSRRGYTITLQYDALGRMTRRVIPAVSYPATQWITGSPSHVETWSFPQFKPNGSGALEVANDGTAGLEIPADTQSFAYDVAGNLLTAVNNDARVRRSYNPNGTLRADTLKIRTYTGTDTTTHVYGLQYAYDLDGRRVHLTHPANLAPRIGPYAYADVAYTYNDSTGALRSVTDPFGNEFLYTYQADGQLARVERGVTEEFRYDLDGRLRRRTEMRGGATIHSDSMVMDARGKVMQAYSLADSTRNDYSGLGMLTHSYSDRYTRNDDGEEVILLDPLGNMAVSQQVNVDNRHDLYPSTFRVSRYQAGTGRLIINRDSVQTGFPVLYADSSAYDASGNRVLQVVLSTITFQGVTNGVENNKGDLREVATFYYDAAERLRVADKRSCVFGTAIGGGGVQCFPPFFADRGTFDEYRYDALGRRILVRTRQEYGCQGTCTRAVTRYVWDGDQLLYEMRYPGHTGAASAMEQDTGYVYPSLPGQFGRVAYSHGAGLDQPLEIARMHYDTLFPGPQIFYPQTDSRGHFDSGTWDDGAPVRLDNGKGTRCVVLSTQEDSVITPPGGEPGEPGPGPVLHGDTLCVEVDFPAPYMWSSLLERRNVPIGPITWMGSLLDEQKDATGQMYRRNRYYDPATGRFTQEDPIGLAGGLNAYGFANGDPVSYDDPYGLCVGPQCAAIAIDFLGAMTSRAMNPDNERKIASLDRSVRAKARLFVNLAEMDGHPVRISQGFRSFEEQDRLYAQGRTAPGSIVTNSKGGQSYHNYGLALDVYPQENGRMNFNATREGYAPIANLAKAIGFEWGGDWTGFRDMPHFQMTGGRSWQTLLQLHNAGR